MDHVRRTAPALSMSRSLVEVMSGDSLSGVGIGSGYVQIGEDVLAIVPPGLPRMPNGIETDAKVERGDPVTIGGGRLAVGGRKVTCGPLWEPRPSPGVRLKFDEPFIPDAARLLGRGPGLTPAGDDLIMGFLAGRALFGADHRPPVDLPVGLTSSLSLTLFRHATQGEVPEPAHAFIKRGDLGPLRAFGHSSGRWIAVGICLGAAGPTGRLGTPADLSIETAEQLLRRCRIQII